MSKNADRTHSSTSKLKTRWLGGLRCRSRIERPAADKNLSSLILESDANHVADLHGTDTSASSVEHLLHALASSMTASMALHADKLGIEVQRIVSYSTGVRAELDQSDVEALPLESIDIVFTVSSNYRAQDLEPLCTKDPMFQTLRRALPISVRVESAQ